MKLLPKLAIRTIGIQTRLLLTLQVVARLEHLVELADRVETKRRLEAGLGEGSDGVNFRGVPKMSNEKKAGLKRLFRVFVGHEILANLYGDYFRNQYYKDQVIQHSGFNGTYPTVAHPESAEV